MRLSSAIARLTEAGIDEARLEARILFSKIGKIKPYTFAHTEDIDVIITDNDFPEDLKQQFKALNIVVM